MGAGGCFVDAACLHFIKPNRVDVVEFLRAKCQIVVEAS